MQTKKLALLSTMLVGIGGAAFAQQSTDATQPVEEAADLAQEAAETAQEAADIAQDAAETAEQAAEADEGGASTVLPEDEAESGMASDTTDQATQPSDTAQSDAQPDAMEDDAESGMASDTTDQATQPSDTAQSDAQPDAVEDDAESGMAGDTTDSSAPTTDMAQDDPSARTPSVGSSDQPYEGNLFGDMTADDVIGMTVVGRDNEAVGEVTDLLIAQDGTVDRAVVDVGGFLGFGSKSVAIDIAGLSIAEGSGEIVSDLDAETLDDMPEWQQDDEGWYSE